METLVQQPHSWTMLLSVAPKLFAHQEALNLQPSPVNSVQSEEGSVSALSTVSHSYAEGLLLGIAKNTTTCGSIGLDPLVRT